MIRGVLILSLGLLIVSNEGYSQSFGEYLEGLPTIPCPLSFNKAGLANHPNQDLPGHLFNDSDFNLIEQKAYAQIELDSNYPLILIGTLSSEGDYFSFVYAYSFDLDGNVVSKKLLAHDLDGEGSDFSVTPENKIRKASYGASDAVINTYRYENGQFIREGEREYADSDNLPEY